MPTVRLASDERPETVREFRVLGSWREKIRGLLGTSPDASPVMLTRCTSIHTFGMAYPIDVAFVGELGEVLEVRRGLCPRAFASHAAACCVMERPSREGPWLEEGEHLWIVSISADALAA